MEEKINDESDSQYTGTEDTDTVEQDSLEEKTKAEEYLANWQRAQADFINYKRRSEQEKREISEYTKSVMALSLLPVLDDFERAITAIPAETADQSWVDGVRLIERKLRTILEAEGLSSIEALGKPFDPHLHEAVRQAKGEEGLVIEEVEKGYMFHDRVIRASKVIVGNGEED